LFAALIITVIVIGAVAIDFAFRSLLVDQARLQLRQVADEIEGLARDASQFGFAEDEAPLRIRLSDRATLDSWASANEYVQIDTTDGQVLGKSSNMGGLTFPPFHPLRGGPPLVFGLQHVSGNRAGTVLVLDTVLTDNDGRPLVIAQLGERLDIVDELIARARFILLVITLAAIVVIAAATYFIAGTAIDPIERLTAEVAEIGSERLDRRLRWTRRDELGRLAAAFDAMLDRLQSAFARERQFISDASHELRTPLTVINGNAQMLQRWGDRDPEILRSSLSAIADESGRLAGMVSGMLTLAKAESGDAIPKEPLVIERIVDDVVLHARELALEKGLTLTSHHAGGTGTIVVGDPGLLRQLVRNLVDNAIKFTTEGSIDVHVRRNGETAAIEVTDTGAGIDEGSADRLFDRFFRGDPAHARATEGTGLGLAIVRSIARVHGGTVRARPRPEGGSTFTVTLPIEPEFTPGS
jgi:signal transduction histidine kinase